MSDIKVSIVIPTRNSSKYISRALDSICAQDYKFIEVLIVDDASDDVLNLMRVAEGYQSTVDIQVIARTEKSNAAVNRNVGVDNTTGDYICFLDADDIFVADKVAAQLNAMVQVGAEWSYTQLYRCKLSQLNNRKVAIPADKIGFSEGFYNYVFVAGGLMQTSTLMVKSSLAKRVSFDERLSRHQDYQYCNDLLASGALFCFIATPLTYWIQEEDYLCPFKKGQTDKFCYQYAEDHGFSGRLLRRYILINIVLVALKSRELTPIIRLVVSGNVPILDRFLIIGRLPIYFLSRLISRFSSRV